MDDRTLSRLSPETRARLADAAARVAESQERADASAAALAAARAARPVRNARPVSAPSGYVPAHPVRVLAWTGAEQTRGLDRYAYTSAMLKRYGHADMAAVPDPSGSTLNVGGSTPDRAILAGEWLASSGERIGYSVTQWSLRQAADAVPVLPYRAIVADAVDAVTAATDDMAPALIADAVAHGQVQATSSGRILASRLSACTGIGDGLSRERAGRAATRALDTWREAVALVTLDMLDAAEYGTRPTRYRVPIIRTSTPAARATVTVTRTVVRPWSQCERDASGAPVPDGATWQGEAPVSVRSRVSVVRPRRRVRPVVTGARVVARGVTLDRDVTGLSLTYGQGVPVPFLVPFHTYRATRTDGTTWQATDAGARRHVGRVPAVALDSLGYPAALGYAPIVCTQDDARIRTAPTTAAPAGEAVAMVTLTHDASVVTARPDLTGAAVAEMFDAIRGRRTRARTAPARATDAPAAPAPVSALDRLRARASNRR